VHERHFDVELGELGLAVGAKVFIAEAAGDLKVTVEPRDHQELLVDLRRLRQGVKVRRVNPRWNKEIAGPFGSAPAQNRRLDLKESHPAHRVAQELAE